MQRSAFSSAYRLTVFRWDRATAAPNGELARHANVLVERAAPSGTMNPLPVGGMGAAPPGSIVSGAPRCTRSQEWRVFDVGDKVVYPHHGSGSGCGAKCG